MSVKFIREYVKPDNMDLKTIQSDPLVIEWLEGIDASKSTFSNYTHAMRRYCNFTGLTPIELLEEAEAEITGGVLMRKRKIKGYLISFRSSLKDEGLAPKSIGNIMTGANSFYRCNDIDLPNLNNRKQFSPKPLKKNSLWIEKTDIQAILEHAGVRDRAIILIMVSSGLAQSDVLDLRVKDIKNGYDENTGITTLSVRRIKTDYDFTTFLTPEAGRAVLSWIELRNQKHEKFKVRSDNDFLFIKRDVPDSYLKTYDDSERLLDKYGLMAIFRRLSVATGRETDKGTWSLVRAHNLRKYFNSTLLNNGADIFFTDYLMGHKIDQMHEAYYRADPVKLREKYMRSLPFLSLEDTEVKMIESPEYQELKNNYDTMCDRVKELERKDSKKEDLLEFFEEHPDIIESIKEFVAKKD